MNEDANDEPFSEITVLIVEDEAVTRRLIKKLLDSLGVGGVIEAENGVEALERLGESGATIDLIITDIEMPEMDGYELVRRVRYGTAPRAQHVPVLVLTGKDTDRNVRKAQIHKISAFIVKPPTRHVLETEIREALGL